jgi:hypothetical protein
MIDFNKYKKIVTSLEESNTLRINHPEIPDFRPVLSKTFISDSLDEMAIIDIDEPAINSSQIFG